MDNDSDKITANEINKFSYCPYQFYYERVYGQKRIREIRSAILEEKGYTDKTKSKLRKGLDFHNNYNKNKTKKYPIFKLIVLVLLLVIGISFHDELLLFINTIFGFFSSM